LGNLREFRQDILGFLERCQRQFGDLVLLRLGRHKAVIVSDPAAIEEVLVTRNRDFRKHFGTRLLEPVLGNSILLSEGETWLRQRRLMQPAFVRRMTEAFCAVVERQSAKMAASWQAEPSRDLYRDMTRLTAQVACEAFLGLDVPDQQAEFSEAMECVHADYERRFTSLVVWPMWLPTPANLRLRRALRTLDGFIEGVIAARIRSADYGTDALSLLLEARAGGKPARNGPNRGETGMTDRQLRDEVMTLLLAGHDTTANALSWCWVLLSRHPHVLDKLRREVAEVCQGRVASFPELGRLAYTRQVVQEAMRLYPPVWAFGREAIRDTTIAGYHIPRGTAVLPCQWLVHRDQRWFDQSLEFLPERWAPAVDATSSLAAMGLPAYAYFPFGGGPRVCIGKDLAVFEAVLILAQLPARFEITLDQASPPVPWPTVTLRPREGIRATVRVLSG
jgi:cytochrome P450